MKKIFLFIIFLSFVAGADTLSFSTPVNELANGDTFFADIHWHSLKDSLKKAIDDNYSKILLISDGDTLFPDSISARAIYAGTYYNIPSPDSSWVSIGVDSLTGDSIYARVLRSTEAIIADSMVSRVVRVLSWSNLDSIKGDTLHYRRSKLDTSEIKRVLISRNGFSTLSGDNYVATGSFNWSGLRHETNSYNIFSWANQSTNLQKILIGGRTGDYSGSTWDYANAPYQINIQPGTGGGTFGLKSNEVHVHSSTTVGASGDWTTHAMNGGYNVRYENAINDERAFIWQYKMTHADNVYIRDSVNFKLKYEDINSVNDKNLMEFTPLSIACSTAVFWADSIEAPSASIDTLTTEKVSGAFHPRRLSQETMPTPSSGELILWHNPSDSVALVFNDPVDGVVSVGMK